MSAATRRRGHRLDEVLGPRGRRLLSSALLVVHAVLLPAAVHAVSFVSFDARSMAMGGTGVATATDATAHLFNPALPGAPAAAQDAPVVYAYAGGRLIDRERFLDTVGAFRSNNSEQSLDRLWRQVGADFSSGSLDAADMRAAAATAERLLGDIVTLADKPLRASASAGFGLRWRRARWGFGVSHRRYVAVGGQIRVADVDVTRMRQFIRTVNVMADVADQLAGLDDLAASLDLQGIESLVDDAIASGRIGPDLAVHLDVPGVALFVEEAIRLGQRTTALQEFLDLDALVAALTDSQVSGSDVGLELRNYLRYQVSEDVESRVESAGAQVAETTFSVALPALFERRLHLGLNLNWVNFTTVDYQSPVNEFSIRNYTRPSYRKIHTDVNVDVGTQYAFDERWSLGLVVRNLIPREYTTVAQRTVRVDPIARVGLSFSGASVLAALDLDLTRNESLGFDPDKRYLGLGVQWSTTGTAALRAGYRVNLNGDENLPSLGIGLTGPRWRFDAAVARAPYDREWGLSLQLGLDL